MSRNRKRSRLSPETVGNGLKIVNNGKIDTVGNGLKPFPTTEKGRKQIAGEE
jgi:hypothetical protein